MRVLSVANAVALVLAMLLSTVTSARPAAADTATCTSTVGAGIPAPAGLPAGIPGFHATWYGQSGYMSLCPGDTKVATVAYYNTGSNGWVLSRMGQAAFLGTNGPEPGTDQPSILGGDGTNGTPATGWPRYNRVAAQPADYVGPGQVAWFQFTVKAPMTPGVYVVGLAAGHRGRAVDGGRRRVLGRLGEEAGRHDAAAVVPRPVRDLLAAQRAAAGARPAERRAPRAQRAHRQRAGRAAAYRHRAGGRRLRDARRGGHHALRGDLPLAGPGEDRIGALGTPLRSRDHAHGPRRARVLRCHDRRDEIHPGGRRRRQVHRPQRELELVGPGVLPRSPRTMQATRASVRTTSTRPPTCCATRRTAPVAARPWTSRAGASWTR